MSTLRPFACLQLACMAMVVSIWSVDAAAVDVSARVKWFGTLAWLPEEDVQRQQSGTPAFDDNFDLRLMVRHQVGPLTLLADHATTLVRGDAVSGAVAGGTPLDQVAASDDARLVDLTWTLSDGGRHRLQQRFDRLALAYRSGPWAVTAGRQAVSWGNGLVFQPLDLFNPFSPTAVDQDYKAGDDLLLVERALTGGGSMQLLVVGRRDEDGRRSADAASAAAKWHAFVGPGELELMAGRHYEDRVLGAAGRLPLGGALLRSDVLATRLAGGGWKLSGIVNIDYSTLLGGRNLYLFAEYFHNGFGVRRLPDTAAGYPEALAERLQRGELFSLMRDYVAGGGSLEWHPLWTQSLTLIGNLDDGSLLLQTQLSHEPDDHQRLELGLLAPLGRAGDEFGGVPVATDAVTTGGGARVYLRWAWYF
ncbi:MAG: hypothetical protein RIB46_18145 [Pseudomonadales bacterium]